MNHRCDKCGSANHAAFDCSKPYNGWKEREPAQARPERKTAIFTHSGAENAPKRKPSAANTALEPPRWCGGPGICPAANLPAFEDEKAAGAFHAPLGSTSSVSRSWLCAECGHWHYLAEPGGDYVTTGPLPTRKNFPFLSESTRREMDERIGRMTTAKVGDGELPKQNQPERSVALPKRKKAEKQEALF